MTGFMHFDMAGVGRRDFFDPSFFSMMIGIVESIDKHKQKKQSDDFIHKYTL
jgi:hypothetical protein